VEDLHVAVGEQPPVQPATATTATSVTGLSAEPGAGQRGNGREKVCPKHPLRLPPPGASTPVPSESRAVQAWDRANDTRKPHTVISPMAR
jgi:hypothetical protein